MSKAEEIIGSINNASEVEIMEFDFDPCFDYLREMESAMKLLVDRVDKGEIRSSKTYAQFKEILKGD